MWDAVLESIITISIMPDGALDLTANSTLWAALTTEPILAKCIATRLLYRPNLSFLTDDSIAELPGPNLIANIIGQPHKLTVEIRSPGIFPYLSSAPHLQGCYLPSLHRAQLAMRMIHDGVKVAMKHRGTAQHSALFVLPSELKLDCIKARCACGQCMLAEKDILKPLIKIMSGSYKTLTKPIDVEVVQPGCPVEGDEWARLPTTNFSYC
jgi:hypothetical protein